MSFAATALWCVLVVLRACGGDDTRSGADFSFLQVRASCWFADHLVRLHCVYDRAQVRGVRCSPPYIVAFLTDITKAIHRYDIPHTFNVC